MNIRLLALLISICPTFLLPQKTKRTAKRSLHEQIAPRAAKPAIISFDAMRDLEDVANIFDADRQWFAPNSSYSIADDLRSSQPGTDDFYMKVLRNETTLFGFVMYTVQQYSTGSVGTVNFLGVNKEYRGKRYGEQLLAHAVEELQRMGAQRIQLAMYVGNEPAQKLYHRFGFHEVDRSSRLIHFQYVPQVAAA